MKILLLSSSRFMECQWGNSYINCDTNHVYIPLTVNEVGVTWSLTFFSLICFLFPVRVRARFRYSCTEGSFCLAVSQLPTLSVVPCHSFPRIMELQRKGFYSLQSAFPLTRQIFVWEKEEVRNESSVKGFSSSCLDKKEKKKRKINYRRETSCREK